MRFQATRPFPTTKSAKNAEWAMIEFVCALGRGHDTKVARVGRKVRVTSRDRRFARTCRNSMASIIA